MSNSNRAHPQTTENPSSGSTPEPAEPRLAREGTPFYLTPALIGFLALLVGWHATASLFLVLAAAIALFFRNPRRYTPTDQRLVISPADGIVVSIGDVDSTRVPGQPSRRVSIFLSVLDVHVNRYPCGGTVRDVTYNPGKFLAAFNHKASTENEQQATLIDTQNNGWRVLVVQIAGLIARRIICYATPEQTVGVGKLMGLIRFGSRVDLFLPAEWPIVVKPGQRMRGGETIVAVMEGKRA